MTGRARTGTGAEDPAPTRPPGPRTATRSTPATACTGLAVLGGAAILLGSVGLTGYNPITGARNLWDRFFPATSASTSSRRWRRRPASRTPTSRPLGGRR